MKKLSLLLTTLLVTFFLSFSEEIKLNEEHNYFEITNKSLTEFSFVNNFSGLDAKLIKIKEGDFIKLFVGGYAANSDYGKAELPELSVTVIVTTLVIPDIVVPATGDCITFRIVSQLSIAVTSDI